MKWQVVGKLPHKKKFILAVAPHTSNWDFFIAVLVMLALRLKITFLGKKKYFCRTFWYVIDKIWWYAY
jgi:1-acyl-sn-glycerol-3-phosphate acyltransferase